MDKTRYSIRQIHISRGNKNWYGCAHSSVDGKIKFVSLMTTEKSVAQEWLRNKQAEEMLPEAIRKSYKDVDIITAENDFSAYLSTKNKLTYETYLSKIRQIWLFLKEENVGTLRQITPTVLTKFLASRYAGSTRTVQERWKLLRRWCIWSCERYEMESFHPYAKFKIIRHDQYVERGFWTMEEVGRILENAVSPHHKLFLGFMAYAGLRFSESLNMKWDDLDLKSKTFSLIGKMGKFATLPISDKLMELISSVYNDTCTGNIFSTPFPQRDDTLLAWFKISIVRAKLMTDGGHHKLRHSFCSNLLRAGVNIRVVQKLMRHSTASITLSIYSHVLDSDISTAVNIL